MNNIIFIAAYVLIGLYIIYKLFWKKDAMRDEYEKLYNTILNSDKYKVKGQYDKEN